jgi:hypothetical protein
MLFKTHGGQGKEKSQGLDISPSIPGQEQTAAS